MKTGYNEATAKGCSSLEQDLRLCEEAGFDYIEIRLDMLRQYLNEHSLEDLKRFFASSRLKPHAFNALYTYRELFGPDDIPARRAALLEEFLLGCRVGREIGSHSFIVVPPMREGGYQSPYEGAPEESIRDCVRILTGLSDIAGDYGINLCLELVGAPKSSVRTIGQAVQIVRAVDRDNVGYVFDACNIFMCGKRGDFSGMAQAGREKLFAVHINDYDDLPEEQLCPAARCFCGQGVIDLGNYLSVLKKMGYEGMVSIETFRPEHWRRSPGELIREAYDTTRKILLENACLS